MIIVKLYGGLGNQMFQYAFIRSLSISNGLGFGYHFENPPGVHTKRSYELSIFHIKGKLLSDAEFFYSQKGDPTLVRTLKKILKKPVVRPNQTVREKSSLYDALLHESTDNVTYFGYWQTEKYFKKQQHNIMSDFVFKNKLTGKNHKLAKQLKLNMCVSIHVRRGDYVEDKNTHDFHGTCSPDYYSRAMALIKKKVKSPKFVVFSDDISWCKEKLRVPNDSIFVDWNKGRNGFIDMQLMSLCNHNIIANSSFSWWGAWLNSNPKKIVIAPKNWFRKKDVNTKDLVPENWIRYE